MNSQKGPLPISDTRCVTLNTLRDQQYSLNRQMLLAIQTHDTAAQERLNKELAELQRRIDNFGIQEYRRQ